MGRGRHEARRPRRAGAGVGVAVLVAAVVLGLVLLVRAVTGDGNAPSATGGSVSPTRPAISREPPTSTPPAPGSPGAPSATGSGSMMPMGPTVQLRLVGTSWIEARAMPSGRLLVARLCHAGDVLTFGQRVVEVTIGNAAAVRMTANGMPTPLGAPGVVRRITVTRGGD
jgi:hypothetical protein